MLPNRPITPSTLSVKDLPWQILWSKDKCTLCGQCTAVCPEGIDPKSDILMLRTKSTQMGHTDPNMGAFGSFGLDF